MLNISDWFYAFKAYFTFVNLRWQLNQDGAGSNLQTRTIQLDQRYLQQKIFSPECSVEEGLQLIDTLSCLDFNLYGDLAEFNVWELRCTNKFLKDVEAVKADALMQRLICMYVLMASRGIILINNQANTY